MRLVVLHGTYEQDRERGATMTTGVKRPNPMHVRAEAKADVLFTLYASLGAERSLRAVYELCGKAGVKIAVATLENYSRQYHWVERAQEFDEARAEAARESMLVEAIADDVKHQRLANLLIDASMDGLKAAKEAEREPTYGDISRLAQVGFTMARTVSGRATSIQSTMVEFEQGVLLLVADLFMRAMEAAADVYAPHINHNADVREEAARAAGDVFGEGMNNLLEHHFRAINTDMPGLALAPLDAVEDD